jgi:hypothetical protein
MIANWVVVELHEHCHQIASCGSHGTVSERDSVDEERMTVSSFALDDGNNLVTKRGRYIVALLLITAFVFLMCGAFVESFEFVYEGKNLFHIYH